MQHAIGGLTRFAENPANFEIAKYERTEKKMLLEYMKSFELCGAGGHIEDCRTGKSLAETNCFFEDDEFMWSSQDIYHVEKYNAAVKQAFIDHVKRKKE